jgi:hydrogenase expression/formation protein HypE
VTIVTGDTKVVEKGHGDGCYINTAGIGRVSPGIEIGPERAQPGDAVLVSGTLGDHGMAIMSAREGLQFESTIQSDSAPLGSLVREMLAVCPDIHVLRDPTRGGLAASLNEIATQSDAGFEVEESLIPVDPIVASACEILGLDPLLVANEGKLLAIVPPAFAESLLATMRGNPLGKQAAKIGCVTESHPRMVVAKTAIGGTRVITTQIGEQLPRIC